MKVPQAPKDNQQNHADRNRNEFISQRSLLILTVAGAIVACAIAWPITGAVLAGAVALVVALNMLVGR